MIIEPQMPNVKILSLVLIFDKLLLHRKNYMETLNSRLLQLKVGEKERTTDVKTKILPKIDEERGIEATC